MEPGTKVIFHGSTVIDASSIPPPYGGIPPPYSGIPPPGPGPYGPPAAIIHTSQPVIVAAQVGPQPAVVVCRSCHAEIVTRVELKPSTKTHLLALGLCIFGCWCCVCIPYCTNSCKNTNHYCPNCNAYIGEYKH